jgi:hypothetical protein
MMQANMDKDCIIVEDFTFRNDSILKCGDISWRCTLNIIMYYQTTIRCRSSQELSEIGTPCQLTKPAWTHLKLLKLQSVSNNRIDCFYLLTYF